MILARRAQPTAKSVRQMSSVEQYKQTHGNKIKLTFDFRSTVPELVDGAAGTVFAGRDCRGL